MLPSNLTSWDQSRHTARHKHNILFTCYCKDLAPKIELATEIDIAISVASVASRHHSYLRFLVLNENNYLHDTMPHLPKVPDNVFITLRTLVRFVRRFALLQKKLFYNSIHPSFTEPLFFCFSLVSFKLHQFFLGRNSINIYINQWVASVLYHEHQQYFQTLYETLLLDILENRRI